MYANWNHLGIIVCHVGGASSCQTKQNSMYNFVFRGKFACLEEVNCRIKPGCKGHPPWPRGICSKCQPSAVTLNRQVISFFLYSSQLLKSNFHEV